MATAVQSFPLPLYPAVQLVATYDTGTLQVSTIGLENSGQAGLAFSLFYQGVMLRDGSSPPNCTRVLPALQTLTFDVSHFNVALGNVTGLLPPGWGYQLSSA